MEKAANAFRRGILLAMAASPLLLGACDDPTVIDDHPSAAGIALFEGTTEIYRFMLDDGDEPTLTLAPGMHDVSFVLLDGEGELIAEEEEGGEHDHALEITSLDPSVLTWTPEDHTDEVHDFVEFHGELNAIQAGTATLQLCVPHEGHCDFEADVPVTVTDQTSAIHELE